MTAKEHLHQLVEDLPEDLPEAAITLVERVLGLYRISGGRDRMPGNGRRSIPTGSLAQEERRARVRAARG